jgi:predicted  nucleic acid-binding Zn-ribbon protein
MVQAFEFSHQNSIMGDWLSKLGKAGFETLVKSSVEKVINSHVEPRLKALESELHALRDGQRAMESELRGLRDKLEVLEVHLDMAKDITQLKFEVAELKRRVH